MTAMLPSISREYVYCEGIQAFRAGEVADPTALPVDVAIIPTNRLPAETDVVPGAWYNPTTVRVLVGPGGTVNPGPGSYTMWLRVRGAVEQPWRAVGGVLIRP